MLAERAGLEVDNGIVCDARLETSVEGIYAAGDVCSYDSVVHGRRLRVEHWDVALQQGQYAARAMLGEKSPTDVVPYFFSDLADWASLEYVGPREKWDEIVWRGDRDAGEFSVWYLDGRQGRRRARRSAAPRTSPTPAGCSVGAPTCRATRDALADADSDWRRSAAGPRRRTTWRGSLFWPTLAPWCNGNTPASGAGIRGSSPWGAVMVGAALLRLTGCS